MLLIDQVSLKAAKEISLISDLAFSSFVTRSVFLAFFALTSLVFSPIAVLRFFDGFLFLEKLN